ncbi:DUF6879 family protein [Actinokineospora sp. 24-640]
MHELLSGADGNFLDLNSYQDSFRKDYSLLGKAGGEFWKLERRQLFQEPEMPSWHAYLRGDWDEARRLAESLRPELEREYRDDAARGIRTWWIKVVELPIQPYVQWSFEPLRVRAQAGEQLRIVRADEITGFEEDEPLPEMITLGETVMYEIAYGENGSHNGAIRIHAPDTIARCRRFLADLYAIGEDIESFYEREVVHLAPPVA